VYNFLWEGVSRHDTFQDGHLDIQAKENWQALTRYFSGGGEIQGPGGHPWYVVLPVILCNQGKLAKCRSIVELDELM